ncbi:DinB family protein [Tahibacter caeni]|uniref:DinB family protein n=1 Tax=Tahibacter caeni TaxID=1453545 RepID=UPI0021472D81|nr:DinB family protein [Tahibacter caeni]
MTPQTAALMAGYNRWMNDRVFEATATLDDATLAADKGAFFGSILGTLNHIAVADSIWLHRFAQHPASFAALGAMSAFPLPTSLTQSLAPDLAALRGYRRQLDELIERWVPELTQEQLSADLTYANLADVRTSKNFSLLLQHFFNHQTHHRGQVTTLLFQSGVDVGVTDLLAFAPRSEAQLQPYRHA